jgi:dihydroorotate dehydrogenase electron transfer subunit
VVGKGTQHLSTVAPGTVLKGIGPCGKGFTIPQAQTAVLVAGGIGIAPLKILAERLRAERKQVLIYFGAVRREMLLLGLHHSTAAVPRVENDDEAGLLGAVCGGFYSIGGKVLQICAAGGSVGEKALVTDMLEQGIREGCVPRENVCLYACGPAGMLRATAAIAESHSLPCQVSLEERMACGIGVCYACTCNVSGPNGAARKARVCREGPVFDARDIRWKD